MACLCQHFETEQDVVVPVVGIEQLEKIIADHSTIAETFKQLMLKEVLGCPFAGCSSFLMPGYSTVKAKCTQRKNGFGKRGDMRLAVFIAVPATVGPLPVQQALGEAVNPLIRQAQLQQSENGIAFHRSTHTHSSCNGVLLDSTQP